MEKRRISTSLTAMLGIWHLAISRSRNTVVALRCSDVHDARKFAMRPLRNAVRVSHCGQPGHNARTCPVLLAAAPVPYACSSKASSSAMHTTAESVGQQGTHMRAHIHTQTYTHMRAHTHTYMLAQIA